MARNARQSRTRNSKKRPAPRTGRTSARTRRPATAGTRATRSHLSKTTIDHDDIQRWAEERGGRPACVQGTGSPEDIGMIRIEFPGAPKSRDQKLQEITWDEFFDQFDDQGLALVYEDRTSRGAKSNFNKLVKRENARAAAAGA